MPKSFAAEGLRKPGATTTPLVHLQVPPGMDAALRGLTREVLRRQPSDLYLFAHRYFESLLAARVAQQEGEEVTDAESLFSKKQSMRDLFQEDESKRSREIVHRIHLEDDASSDKNVVHNINIEVEGEDASIEETTVKVEITEDEGKKKRRENTSSFEEEITTTRTEHMTMCKSWKVETRVETCESGEIRVESFTNAGKTKQSSKPRKFASEEEKKSRSLIEEEKRAAKAQREKTKRESSKSSENIDKSASRELIILERQADAQKSKRDEWKKYKSFVRLDDSAADESERLIEIEREGALTRSRRDVGDSTREVSPDGSLMTQSPQVAVQKMEESLIQLKELETKAESLKRAEEVSKVLSEVAKEKLTSPEDALIKMERSLIDLKETSKSSATEKQKDEISTDLEKGSWEEKQSISIKSEGESKSSDISEEKHKIIESLKEVVHEIEEKASRVSSHIHETQTAEEKQSKEDSEKHKIIKDVKEVVHKIEEKASSVLSHIHGSQSSEEKQSLKSEDHSISEKRNTIIKNVKEVAHEIEEKSSNVLTHFPEKSTENADVVDLKPDDKESIVVEAQSETEAEKSSELDKTDTSFEKTEVQDPKVDDKESIAVDVQKEERDQEAEKVEDEKTEVLDPSADDKESIEVEVREIERDSGLEKVEHLDDTAKDTELNLEGKVVETETIKQSPEQEKTAEETESSDLKGEDSIVVEARMLAHDAVEDTKEQLEKMESFAEKTEVSGLKDKQDIEKAHIQTEDEEDTEERLEEIESSVEQIEILDLEGKERTVEEERTKADDDVKDSEEKLRKMESSAEKSEALDLQSKECTEEEGGAKAQDKVDDAEEKPGKMESPEKTEASDLQSKERIVEETRMETDEVEDIQKDSLEQKSKTEGGDDKKEQEDEVESKGRQKREVEAEEIVEKAEDETTRIEKPDLDHGSKDESTDKALARQSSKEEKRTSSQQSKDEGQGKETEGGKSTTDFTNKHDDNAAEILLEKKDDESPGEQPQKRSADGSLEEENGKKEESKEEASLLSKESEHKEGVKVTEGADAVVGSTVGGAELSNGKEIQEETASKTDLEKDSDQLEEKVERGIESKFSTDKEKLEEAADETTVVKDAATDGSKLSVEKEATSESESKEMPVEREAPQEKVEEKEVKTEAAPGETLSRGKDTSQVVRVLRSTEETFTKTEEVSESISTSIMTQKILLGGPENEVRSMQTEVKEHQEEKSQHIKTHVVKEVMDIDDVFGHKMYPIEEVNTLLEPRKKDDDREDGAAVEIEVKIEDSAGKTSEPVAESSGDVKTVESVESSDGVDDSAAKPKEGEGSIREESSEEKPRQRKLASLDEESSSVSEGTGDGFLPPTVVISRVADVVELTDGEAKIVSQMEKEGLTTEYDENIKVRTGHWSAEDAKKFLAGESQHTYHTLRKPELVYSDLHEFRPPEKSVSEESEKRVSKEPENSEEVEAPLTERVVEEQEESSPEKTDSLGQDSDSKEGPVEITLVEVDDGKEMKDDKPWLARANTVEEIFEKETVGEVIPVTPTPPRRSSVPGQVNVMMEMSKATSRIGQSIMVLSGGEKRPVQRSDSDEYCISEDAIYIPLKLPRSEPDIVEESDEEPFRIDQPPPTFTYDSDEGKWGAALAEHVKKDPTVTTVIIEREQFDDPSALGRVTITEITDEEEKAMSKEQDSTVSTVEELPKPVFEIGSPVSDRSMDMSELRTDAKHRPSLADISEENPESADDNEGSMNVELHISLSDGDNLSQRSYGTESERKWTEDLSNVAHKAKEAATGMIMNLFSSSPRRDRHSPARSESSIVSEASTDGGGKRTRKRSESKEESERQKETEVVEYETKQERIEAKSAENGDRDDSRGSSKQVVDTKSSHTEKDLPGEEKVENKDQVTPRSLQESSETSESLTSVSVPLPDASYDLPNVISTTSTIDSPGDSKDAFEGDVPSDSSKPQADEAHQKEGSHRSKRSVEQDVAKDQSDEKKETEGSGAAAGTAVQNVAEAVQNVHEKTDTRVSAKDQKETGLAGQEPASEPKDSMTSVISETLDSVESLPSEVSKNLWSIEDAPLGENLNESGVQEDEKKGSESTVGEGSSKMKTGAIDELLEKVEHQVETMEESIDDLKDKAEEKVTRGAEKVQKVAREAKEDMHHKLKRAAEVVEESLEDVGNEKIKSEVEQELKDTSLAIEGALTSAKDDIEGGVKVAQKGAEDAKEEVENIGKNIKEMVDKGEAEVVETVEKGRSKVGGMLDRVGEAISEAEEKVASAAQEERHHAEDLKEKASETANEISAKVSENVSEAQHTVEEKVEEGKSGFGKFIGGVTDAISEVKGKISETITNVKEDVKSLVSESEERVGKEVSDIKETVEEQAKKVESGIKEKMNEAGKLKSQVFDDVESTALKEADKLKEIAGKAGDEVNEVTGKIGEEVEKATEEIEEAVHEVADKVKQTGKIGRETISDEGTKLAESISERELDKVEKRLEDSIEHVDDGIDTVDGTKGTEIDQESKAQDVGDSVADATSSTRMVLDKRKSDSDKLEEVEASKVLARSIESPETIASADANTDSSGKEDSSETRRSKRHMLQRGVTLGDQPRSADTIPSESVDETSLERADTVIHMTPDDLVARETTRMEEVVVPIHVEHQDATPDPPGKDTKATETDLLEKETVSRGTEPEETSEQIAEALRSEVKDLEERLSRLRESTWSLSYTGPDSRKEEEDVHSSKGQGDDVNERTVHVKKSISSAESMSFASRVLSTPMGSVREEFSEMKKSKAETTLETILTVEKGVQSEGSEVGKSGRGDAAGPKTTVTTATQVSVPSNETSDDESRKSTFQRAKSMDAKIEARAITNFSKRNSTRTVETKKAESSRKQQKKSAKPPDSVPPNRVQDFLATLSEKYDLSYLNAKATIIQAAYRGFRTRRDLLRINMNIVHKNV